MVLKRTVFYSREGESRLFADLRCCGLLWQKNGLDVRQNTTLGDGDARQQLVQLLVVTYCELEVTGNYASLLVVAGSVTGELEDLGRQVLHDRRQIDGRSCPNSLGIITLAQQTMNSADGELESGPA